MKRVQTPLFIACLLIPVTVLLRVVSVVRYSDEIRDWFPPAAAGILVIFSLLMLFAGLGKKAPTPRPQGKRSTVISVLILLCGAALLICSLADTIGWVNTGVTPPPTNHNVQMADGLLLIVQLFFGVLGGIHLLFTGFGWLQDKACTVQPHVWPALAPVLWGWFRLARYAVSYVSATGLGETVYDYGYLIFSLLFLMLLAHFIAGTRPPRQSNWITAALPTAWFGIGGFLATAILSVLPASAVQHEIHAGNMVGWADLPLAVTALIMAADALLSKPLEEAPVAVEATEEPVIEEAVVETDRPVAEESAVAEEVIAEPMAEESAAAEEDAEPTAEESAPLDEAELISQVLRRSEENAPLDELLSEFASSDPE